jgi:hypothetical protein
MPSARMMLSSSVRSSTMSPLLRCTNWLVKPVQSSTSISSSVILTCGSIEAAWLINAWAASGTVASNGVIFRPDSVMIASGNSLAAAMRLTTASCSPSSDSRSCRYCSQSAVTASGRSPACLRAANFAAGMRYSSKSLNWREPSTQMSPERSAFFSSDNAHSS